MKCLPMIENQVASAFKFSVIPRPKYHQYAHSSFPNLLERFHLHSLKCFLKFWYFQKVGFSKSKVNNLRYIWKPSIRTSQQMGLEPLNLFRLTKRNSSIQKFLKMISPYWALFCTSFDLRDLLLNRFIKHLLNHYC